MKAHVIAISVLFAVGYAVPSTDTGAITQNSWSNSTMPFFSHVGPEPGDNALVMNVDYGAIRSLRGRIEKIIGRELKYFKLWNPEGEAHVTVVNPFEFDSVLSKVLTMQEIEEIALESQIQASDLKVLGIGSGKKQVADKLEETFFVIVESLQLRAIRLKIWDEFVRKGGDPSRWDPTWFFPHITIGYTDQDFHEPDVLKNIRGSWDERFQSLFEPSYR